MTSGAMSGSGVGEAERSKERLVAADDLLGAGVERKAQLVVLYVPPAFKTNI